MAARSCPMSRSGPTGALADDLATHFLVGAVAHPFAGNDFYAYYGQEQNRPTPGLHGATQGGLGNVAYTNNQCAIELGAAAGTGSGAFNQAGVVPAATCAFNVQKTQEFTVGFWQDAYKGDLGRVRVGLQYEYVRTDRVPRRDRADVGHVSQPNAGLSPNNNVVFLSLRYYPFN